MKDRSDDPSHYERTLLPRSYISQVYNYNSLFALEHGQQEVGELLVLDAVQASRFVNLGNLVPNGNLKTQQEGGNVLFNDTLNTFLFTVICRQTYARWPFSERGNLLLPLHGLHFPIRKEGNVLFNDALNTCYLRLYGIRHMVKDHSDSERGNCHLAYVWRHITVNKMCWVHS